MSGTIIGSVYELPGYANVVVEGATDSGPFGSVPGGEGFYAIDGTVTTVSVSGYATTTILGVDASGGAAYGAVTTENAAGTEISSANFIDVGGTITILPTDERPVGVDNAGDILIETTAANGAAGPSVLLNAGTATPVTLAGASVEATAISPGGVIAGIVAPAPGATISQYFVGRPGNYAIYADPGEGVPTVVNDSGTVGAEAAIEDDDGAFTYDALLLQDGVVENAEGGGRVQVSVVAIDAAGDVLTYADGQNFLLRPDGTLDQIDAPGVAFPQVTGIDDQGDIFGTGNVDPSGDPYDTMLGSFIAEIPCFAAGTRIAVPGGEALVEHLRVGDLVRTADGDGRSIAWTGHRRVDLASHPEPALARPVVIRSGAFAPNVPARDLRISPDHNIAVADVLIPAKCLVNGTTIVVDDGANAVTYHHIELATHDLVLAEGLAAETYLDVGNRASLSPGADAAADFSSAVDAHWFRWEALGCRPLVLFGPELDGVRSMLRARAAVMARPGTTDRARAHAAASGCRAPQFASAQSGTPRGPGAARFHALRRRRFAR